MQTRRNGTGDSPVLDAHLDPERDVYPADGLGDGEVEGGILKDVAEGADPGVPDEGGELAHAELAVVGSGDLHRRLEVRPGPEELEYPVLDLSVSPSHVLRQLRHAHRRHRSLPTAAGKCRQLSLVDDGRGRGVAEVEEELPDAAERRGGIAIGHPVVHRRGERKGEARESSLGEGRAGGVGSYGTGGDLLRAVRVARCEILWVSVCNLRFLARLRRSADEDGMWPWGTFRHLLGLR